MSDAVEVQGGRHRDGPARGIWREWVYLCTKTDTGMPVGEEEDHVIPTQRVSETLTEDWLVR